MTSSEIRQSFLDFFKEFPRSHTILPSSPLLPDAPNLLFTNAGMNQFVPIFLGQAPCPYKPARIADTQKCIRAGGKHNDLEDVGFDTYHHTFFEMLGNWSFGDYFKKEAIEWAWELVVKKWNFPASRLYATVYCPNTNDWELIIRNAIAAKGDYQTFQGLPEMQGWRQHQGDAPNLEPYPDFEAACHWVKTFQQSGLDPEIHVVPGNKKDNFWMMGDTGPCGPCSELHVNLIPGPPEIDVDMRKQGRALVNSGDARCIEIWNLVFIQFNADPRAEFPLTDLPAKHVDTGMGFERVTSMIQGTKGFTDFSENAKISNYETDVFRPIFDELEKLTEKKYGSTLPVSTLAIKEINFHLNLIELEHDYGVKLKHAEEALKEGRKVRLQLKFRGVEMGRQDEGKNLISRMRADLSQLGVTEAEPELTGKSIYLNLLPLHKNQALEELRAQDVAFRVIADHIRTLSFSIADGIQPSNEGRGYVLRRILRRAVRYGRSLGLREPFLGKLVAVLGTTMGHIFPEVVAKADIVRKTLTNEEESFFRTLERGMELFEMAMYAERSFDPLTNETIRATPAKTFDGGIAFRLYDTYGFPLDLTELMARERGMSVDVAEFNRLMDEQKARGKAAQKKQIIRLGDSDTEMVDKTEFVGYEDYSSPVAAEIRGVNSKPNEASVAVDKTPFYAEMGGQVSDVGTLEFKEQNYQVIQVAKIANVYIHSLDRPLKEGTSYAELAGQAVSLQIDVPRRARIEAHHSGTHLMNWALRKVLGNTITQKGSYVGPDRLRFDFSHGTAMTPEELAEVERLVNEKIEADVPVSAEPRPYAEVKGDPSILQFFGDKYGDQVRVVSIGDFSKELCGGTHVRQSGKVGYFKILHEAAIAAGIRRIEAASGSGLIEHVHEQMLKQEEHHAMLLQRKTDLGTLAAFAGDKTPHAFWKHWEAREAFLRQAAADVAQHEKDSAKQQEAAFQKRAVADAPVLIAFARTVNDVPFLAHNMVDAPVAYLPVLADALKNRWQGVAVLAAVDGGKVALLAAVAPAYAKKIQAGKIIQAIAPLVGGKGGGRPELAQGGGTNPEGVAAALAKAEELVRAL